MKMTKKITLKISGKPLSNGDGTWDLYVVPTVDNPLGQINQGPNPRVLDPEAHPNIEEQWKKDDNSFVRHNGGASAVIDAGSFEQDTENQTISFTCHNNLCGGYDGQHSIYRVDRAERARSDEYGGLPNNFFRLQLSDVSKFTGGVQDIREVAKHINDRKRQTKTSEANIAGDFDALKAYITYTSLENIGFKENQKNINGEKIEKENEAQQVFRLLATLTPMAYDDYMGVEYVAALAKKGETAIELVNDKRRSALMHKTYEHSDFVLELSDYMQESLPEVLGTSYEQYALFKKTSKAQLKKDVKERQYFKSCLFNGGKTKKGSLDKDFIIPFMYAFVQYCFEYNESTEKFVQNVSIDDAKSLWDSHAEALVERFEDDYRWNVLSPEGPKQRKSDFINSTSRFMKLEKILEKSIKSAEKKAA